ncbi:MULTISPECIES: hypothetical protein [unclassified Streptomyces]|uniref:hypothetical protein n=1 Tax=unclassified Streptomyces TaxID=2593676 RepID=UPI001BED33B1|nr:MULTISPECIES: hypothetical protein [unclassified Streptomyces]MBT2402071.1 hypothetical protein [Streptomyces sp. ISL-21]MBT2454906.1 hypothetical protein [Streptomyces sp. ISL-86]MBT2609419.1 hypothetical protein [Streptomyces sp. ISL-87]
MRQKPLNPTPFLLLFLVPVAAWAAWLGWDQRRDVHPDGSVTGPYEAWQVIGLVLTLLAPVYWAASRRHVTGAVLGTTAGLAAATYYDWSDDSSGLFVIGVGMVMTASLVVTFALSALIASVTRDGRRGGSARKA